MKLNKFLFLLMSFMLISATALAQKRVYTGQVVDDQNEPVIGASVIQKGTSNGGVTDIDGNFSVSVDEGATLVVSYIGYASQEVTAADGMRIILKTDQEMLVMWKSALKRLDFPALVFPQRTTRTPS